MPTNKLKIAILFGGRSAEHEVSIQSAKNVAAALDKDKYDLLLVGIDKEGEWHFFADQQIFTQATLDPKVIKKGEGVAFLPTGKSPKVLLYEQGKYLPSPDVVFPVLHGPYGEDGAVQGFLKMLNLPVVGADILGSAVGMDKEIMKRLLKEAGLPLGKFIVIKEGERENISWSQVAKELGSPVFVKPANLGSSVGVSKVENERQFQEALLLAFAYDLKVIVEEFIPGREIECAVLGNEQPRASLPGEIIPQRDFYSYEAKYLDQEGAILKAPAELPDEVVKEVQTLAVKTFLTLQCNGMGRVDFFLKDSGEVLINEINTIPGFTQISMYPKLWEVSGLSYSALLDELIRLALERFSRLQQLQTKYN